jgi:peptide/nickel transport system substrate-binding protein
MTRTTHWRRGAIATAVVAAAALLAACGSSSSTADAPSPAKAKTDSVRIATSASLANLNGLEFNLAEFNLSVYDQLVSIEPDGTLGPDLATSWKAGVDTSQWVFTLRPGVTFSDGTPLTADDIVWTFQTIMASPTSKQKLYTGQIKSITKDSETQLTFDLNAPNAIYPRQTGFIYIVPQKTYTTMGAAAYGKAPIGSGAYTVASYNGVDEVVLKANHKWWRYSDAMIENVTVKSLPDETTRLNGLQAKQYDLALLSGNNVGLATSAGLTVTSTEATKVGYLGFDFTDPLLANPKLREAMSYAIDRSAITGTLLQKLASPTGQLVSTATNGYDKSIKTPAYDVAKAKQLVAESGYTGQTIPLTYAVGYVSAADQVAQAVQGYLKAVGINVELKTSAQATFLSDWQGKKIPGMYLFQINTSSFDASGTWQLLGVTTPTFTEPDLKALIAKQLAEADPAVRSKDLNDVAQLVSDKVLYVPLFLETNNAAYDATKLDWTSQHNGYLLPQLLRTAK